MPIIGRIEDMKSPAQVSGPRVVADRKPTLKGEVDVKQYGSTIDPLWYEEQRQAATDQANQRR